MTYGVENEINAVATFVSKVLPVFFPNVTYVEEGCCLQLYGNAPFLLVSPDGSGREINSNGDSRVVFGLEIKCPFPGKIYTTPAFL